MSTTTKKRRAPAEKGAKHAATQHFAGSKVGPHGPISGSPRSSQGRRKLPPNFDKLNAQAERELDRAFKKLMNFNGHLNDATMIRHLGHVQALLEEETGGQAFILVPDLPIPQPIVDRVLREQPKQISASEALYSFIGWLTTRDRAIMMSAHHNSAAVAEILAIFLQVQGIPAPADNWQHKFITMADVATTITNDPALNPNQCAPPPPTFEEAFKQILGLFRFFHDQRQNHLLARLIEDLSETRLAEFHALTDKIERTTGRHTQLADAAKELDQVLSGNFTIVHV